MNDSWTIERWKRFDANVNRDALLRPVEVTTRAATQILRAFSSSFFLVTRFLPREKRAKVAVIYAAVRYPDEIVDTFSLPPAVSGAMLQNWEESYSVALSLRGISSRVTAGVPWILAAFAEIVLADGIPPQHYRSFLEAMRRDIEPQPYPTLSALIDDYIYGSAIVVGYFLAHVYGPASGVSLAEACNASANLGIALQLTNFCRDVREDDTRGRLYIPQDLIDQFGLSRAVELLADNAEVRYIEAVRSLDVFAEDTRPAIRACIDVYRALNERILSSAGNTRTRHSVPPWQKFRALPVDKYWRVPLALMGSL